MTHLNLFDRRTFAIVELLSHLKMENLRKMETETEACISMLPAYTALHLYCPASSSDSLLMNKEMATSSVWTSVYILEIRINHMAW